MEAARALGASQLRIVFIHILPNCTSPIVVKASMDMGMAILGRQLRFFRLGAQPPYPEWGNGFHRENLSTRLVVVFCVSRHGNIANSFGL